MCEFIRNLFTQERTRTVVECQLCGRTLDDVTDACPQCGWASVAIYEIEE